MPTPAKTVKEYLSNLDTDRRKALEAVRRVILKNLPKGYEEGIQYGAIGYFVPHSEYPSGYHCDPTQPLPFAGLSSRKNHMSITLMSIYFSSEQKDWFCEAWKKTGKTLKMGKSCVNFKKSEDLSLKVIGQAIKRTSVKKYIKQYESTLKGAATKKTATKKAATKKATTKKTATKKTATKKAATKKAATTKPTAKKAIKNKATTKRTAAKGSTAKKTIKKKK